MTFHACATLVLGLALVGCKSDKQGETSAGPRTAFSGQAALDYAKAQLEFGPRIPGTDGARRAGDWIVAQMKLRADTVIEQTWTHTTADGKALPLRNVLARFRPAATERVLYLTHWDTRPISDGDGVPADQRTIPVPGANDGASGVGLFVALGDVLKKTPPSVGVDLLFVDGEDYGSFDRNQDVLMGSTYFADHLPSSGYQPLFGVLWDMIGDRDLQIFHEQNSLAAAPEVVARVWNTAADLGYAQWFVPQSRDRRDRPRLPRPPQADRHPRQDLGAVAADRGGCGVHTREVRA